MTTNQTPELKKFICEGFRPVFAATPREAAEIFAGRLARRRFGKKGVVATLRADSWTEDGTSTTFEAFIARSEGQGQCTGKNEWFHVYTVGG